MKVYEHSEGIFVGEADLTFNKPYWLDKLLYVPTKQNDPGYPIIWLLIEIHERRRRVL